MPRLFIILIFVGFSLPIFSQSATKFEPKIFSPDVTSFMKYGNIPVGEYTGIPNIEVPLYTLNNGDVHLPIKLRYNGGGIRVQEESSWVGLGWSLDVGGMITKDIVGLEDNSIQPDYAKSTMFMNTGLLSIAPYQSLTNGTFLARARRFKEKPNANGQRYTPADVLAEYEDYLAEEAHRLGDDSYVYRGDCHQNVPPEFMYNYTEEYLVETTGALGIFSEMDMSGELFYKSLLRGNFAPDIYSFSFLNYSGKFFIDPRDQKIYIFNDKSNIKFEPLPPKDPYSKGTFKATTTDGVCYFFTFVEEILLAGSVPSSYTYHLEKIEYPNSQIVYFNYVFESGATHKSYIGPTITTSLGGGGFTPSSYNTIPYNVLCLKSIISDNITIDFNSTKQRDDLTGENRLTGIDVSYSGSACDHVKFSYDYFYSPNTGYPNDYLRLKLNSVTVNNDKYTFGYNSTPLPQKSSCAIDHWGYYNGARNSTTLPDLNRLIPFTNFYLLNPWEILTPDNKAYGTADRGASATYSKACILESITYPTGGLTSFIWEPHTFSNCSYLAAEASFQIVSANVSGGENTNKISTSTSITFTKRIDVLYSAGIGIYNALEPNLTELDLINQSNGSYVSIFKDGSEYLKLDLALSKTRVKAGARKWISLDPGTYYVKAYIPDTFKARAGGASISLSYVDDVPWSIGAGLRIAKIVSQPSLNDNINKSIQSYKYEKDDASGSYGQIMSGISYYREQAIRGVSNNSYVYSKESIFSPNNLMPVANDASGALVGYDRVVITNSDVNGGVYGRIEKYFENEASYDYSGTSYLDLPFVQTSTNGLVLKELYYKKDIAKPIKSIEYSYDNLGTHFFWGITATDNWRGPEYFPITIPGTGWVQDGAKYPERINAMMYALRSQKWVPTRESIIESLDGGDLTTTNDYFYNKDGLLSKTEIRLKNGESNISMNKYIGDYDTNFPLVNDGFNTTAEQIKIMATDKKMLGMPVETLKLKGINGVNSVVEGSLIIYGNNFKPSKVFSLKIKDPIAETSFNGSVISNSNFFYGNFIGSGTEDVTLKYDIRSNINEVYSNQNGLRTNYLWGYNNLYPTVKIENASLNDFLYDGFEVNNGEWPNLSYDISGMNMKTGIGCGIITNNQSTELTLHSSKNLYINLSQITQFRFSGWVYSTASSAEIFLFMKRAGETGYFSKVESISTSEKNKWVYLDKVVDVPQDIITLNLRLDNNGSGVVRFDDLRICPAEAQMTTYTYKPLVGMTSSTDPNGVTIHYEYDGFGRLKYIKDNDGKILKKNYYHFKDEVVNW